MFFVVNDANFMLKIYKIEVEFIMKRSIKKLCLNISCVILVCSVQLPAAANDNQVITFDEYYSTLQNEYSKYNILYEIDEYDDTFIFTRDILDEQIAIAKEFAEGFRIEAEMEKPKLDKCGSNYTAEISPRTVMPVNFSWAGTVSILSNSIAAPGGIDLYATCSGQLDLGHNSINYCNHFRFN